MYRIQYKDLWTGSTWKNFTLLSTVFPPEIVSQVILKNFVLFQTCFHTFFQEQLNINWSKVD